MEWYKRVLQNQENLKLKMKLSIAFNIVIRMLLGMAIAFPTHQFVPHIPYGMDDFYPFLARNSTDVLPLSTNLTQVINRTLFKFHDSLFN